MMKSIKKNILVSHCRLSFILLLFVSVVCHVPCKAAAETNPGIIIAFGDSLTEGCDVFVGECGWERSGAAGYDIELEQLLQASFRNFRVHNFGVGGETAEYGVDRIDSILDSACNEGAEYILLLEGTNDLFFHHWPISVKFYLGKMVDKSIAKGLIPILATITPDATPGYEYKNIPEVNEMIRDLAAEKNITLVDLYAGVVRQWSTYFPGCYASVRPNDALHPNATGFKDIGLMWYKVLADMIPPQPQFLTWLNLLLEEQ